MQDQEKKNYKVWEPMLLAIVAVIGMIAGAKLSGEDGSAIRIIETRNTSEAGKITEMIRFIEEKYVDDVDSEKLIEKAITTIMSELDPHSGYISPQDLRKLNEKMEGHFDGIGIEFHIVRDTITVLAVNEGGPADRAGVKPHDRVLAADDSTLVGIKLDSENIARRLRGPKGSSVRITVRRHSVDTLIPFTLVRDRIPISSVVAGYMLDDRTGYIKINRFSGTTYREFMDQLEQLSTKHGMADLVIDVRQNPGGYLKEAVNILSQLFREKGLLLVYTEGEHVKRMDYETTGKPFYEVGNIAVLIDGGSASASEIMAGAIQDLDRGVIVGTKSFGKGLVQEQYALKNGGALRLTTARYYTPSGRSIQKPYENGDSVADQLATPSDSVSYQTRNGRSVLAEGGITPDIVVPNRFDWYDQDMEFLYETVLEYAFYGFSDLHPKSHDTFEALLASFPSSELVLEDLVEYWQQSAGDSFDRTRVEAYWVQGYLLVRAMIASYHFGNEAWYRVMNLEDPVVRQALEAVGQDRRTTLKM